MSNPTQGGSYERQPDGSLKRVEGTEPAPPPSAPVEPAAAEQSAGGEEPSRANKRSR